ncbi:hypothetical protein [Flavobacterium reichenbachii]|uniref:Uncharacterized protein n=1 Tax=Flavobacterium reichenbachii TaxID=362418 RepID=A0A085ZRH6_9FLAO|nr:hypothetical protein [Flavobacterium reichenbachii]KFF07040.1 hypothetical protein IW19_16635 [Flavobacterium reichenbachii]OXB12066.1 hypothetical protein B0A68_19875 [Flavobacterium reichenbachii]
MKKIQKKPYFIILFGLFLNIFSIHSQNNSEAATYNWLDRNLGVESLDFRNGPAHFNFDRTVDNQNRYYISNDFRNGSITYNNQNYYDLYLKYDIYADELILRPYTDSNNMQINLIKDNVGSFKLGNQKFVNLKNLSSTFKGGYYDETLNGDKSILYIKYFKEKNNTLKDNVFLIEYRLKYEFLLLKENTFTLINDKKEIIKLYPDKKRKINDFYFMNRDLKKDDPGLFMKNLMKYINNINL